MTQQFSAYFLFNQKIGALLLLLPSLTNPPPQLLAVKHKEIPLGLRWSILGYALPQAHRYHSSPMNLDKDTISLTRGSTGTDSNPSKSHSTMLSDQSFQIEVRVLLLTLWQTFSISLRHATIWK
ncbi:hypothetical protein AVEN_66073-1 [Araneus ventricosus]|uniref:Uncharacterized protein n=1 Tax=Araneus ventricosus TaxID=182803 RepID=A0A4Y2R007_ARAVE|nr:hypothetical protein AVEN_66073-1 [Araneus ventricosus]